MPVWWTAWWFNLCCTLGKTERLVFWLVRCPSLLPSGRGLVSSYDFKLYVQCTWHDMSSCSWVTCWMFFFPLLCLHSGIIHLCKSGSSGIQSLIGLLCIPNMEVRVCSTEYSQWLFITTQEHRVARFVHFSIECHVGVIHQMSLLLIRTADKPIVIDLYYHWMGEVAYTLYPVYYDDTTRPCASASLCILRQTGSTFLSVGYTAPGVDCGRNRIKRMDNISVLR